MLIDQYGNEGGDDNVEIKIWESGAILTYLAQKYKLENLYPAKNMKIRTDIDSWLHWHHRNSRMFTLGLAGYKLRPEFKATKEILEQNMKFAHSVCKHLEKILATRDFLAIDSKEATLADIIVYGDLGQCQAKWINAFDFSAYPNITKWLQRMEKVKGFAETHEMLDSFCDGMKDTWSKL
jgi:glutathione S-transferase